MTIAWPAVAGLLVVSWLTPAIVFAQEKRAVAGGSPTGPWVVLGAASTTLLNDCTDCGEATYLHSGSVFGQGGWSVNRRTDLGGELFWMDQPVSTGDHVRAAFVLAVLQFRPWERRGFFLKAGGGMAFVRNWLDVLEEAPPSRSKALALELAAGWEWHAGSRLGVQIFGGHHVAALGDLETSERTIENVVWNLWSVGAAIVIR